MPRWRSRKQRDRELRREIDDHLELERETQDDAGRADSQRAALHAFGNPVTVQEDVREAWGGQWLERLWLDVRLAIRLWARTPSFSLIAILTIALGVGASTALIGQVNAVFWTPLAVERPEALRFLSWTAARRPFVNGPNVMAGPTVDGIETLGTVSYPAFQAMRQESQAFVDVACWADLGEARPIIVGEQGFGTVQYVSGNYFRTLGVSAAIGRTLMPDDEPLAGWPPVVVLSHQFWQRTFGGAPDVTSRTVVLNGRSFAIVGVLPEGFFGLDPAVSPDLLLPIGAVEIAAATRNPLQNRGLWNPCRVVARLAPGRSEAEARSETERVLAAFIATAPPSEPYDPPRVWLSPAAYGMATLREGTSTPLIVLLVVVGGLLAAACANIAGLLTTRGAARAREIATRLALGASRARVARQLVTESLVLSSLGGVLGLLLAYWLSGAGRRLLSQFMPTLFGADRELELAAVMDVRVLVAGVALAIVSGLLFGTLPAVRATRLDLLAVIKENARADRPRFGLNAGHTLVLVQTAFAVFLLVTAGLFVRTLLNLRASDLGFGADRLLYARVEPRAGGVPVERRRQFFEDALARLRALPGVIAASAAGAAPMGGSINVGIGSTSQPVCPPGSAAAARRPDIVPFNAVAPGYFATMQVPLVDGRDFHASGEGHDVWVTDSDRPRSVIINQALATRFFPGQRAVGQTFSTGSDCTAPWAPLLVVGVVQDHRTEPRQPVAPSLFFPLGGFNAPVTLIVRTAGAPDALIPSVRRAVTEVNAQTPTFSEAPVPALIERQLRQERLLSTLLIVFAGVTLLICALGIYGLLAYAVERRRPEISIRLAVGAQVSTVVGLIVRESLLPVLAGMVVGAAASAVAGRWAAQLLYGVSPYDPLTLVGASAILLLVAAVAAALPSRAAARVDPVLALRQ